MFTKVVIFVLLVTAVSGARLYFDGKAGTSILDIATQNGCGQIVNLVNKAGLAPAITSAKSLTFFAPSDDAVAAIPKDVLALLSSNVTLLQEVLKFHVLPVEALSTALKNELLLNTLVKGSRLRINLYQNGTVATAEGSVISKVDLKASNGVVHVLDKVIFPLPTVNIDKFVVEDKMLQELKKLLQAAKLKPALKAQNLTLFAPNDAAIAKLPSQVVKDLLKNKTQLADVLSYHVLNSTVYSAGLPKGQTATVTALNGKPLQVQASTDGKVKVNDAQVMMADVSVTNGVIHVIDTVLIPPKYH